MTVEPRQAASLILLRESADGAEVLLVQRNPEQRFMGGAWVFPGGAVHAEEDADQAATAVRELEEEAGIALSADTELVPFSRWITPEGEGVSIRFDTWFYAARAPEGAEARHRRSRRRWPPPARGRSSRCCRRWTCGAGHRGCCCRVSPATTTRSAATRAPVPCFQEK